MSAARGSFEVILADFKKNLTPGEVQDFQFVTLNDVRETAHRIQKDQENLKKLMNMARLESFLEAMKQFGKVIEVFGNSSIFVAFVWGPLKFILQVIFLSLFVHHPTRISRQLRSVTVSFKLLAFGKAC
jgi:hypothetical protein